MKTKRNFIKPNIWFLIFLCALVYLFFNLYNNRYSMTKTGGVKQGLSSPVKVNFKSSGNVVESLQNAFAAVVQKTMPAVVLVKVKQRIPSGTQRQPITDPYDALLQRFLLNSNNSELGKLVQIGVASGFIIRDDGYIVTNYHVVKGTNMNRMMNWGRQEYYVQLKSGDEYKAKVIGVDAKADIALLKVDVNRKLPYLEFGNSDEIKIGHWVIAIGAPFNLDYTVTAGIVSQKGRAVGLNAYENYIQTDASINPGNSGGPLLNLKGQVIGINDFILSSPASRGSIGLGFAIASNFAKRICDDLIATGKVVRPWIGISMSNLTQEMKRRYVVKYGVLVQKVHIGDPADKAGIEPGDIITAIDGKPVKDSHAVQMAVLRHKPGDNIKITVNREGKVLTLNVVASSQDELKLASMSNAPMVSKQDYILQALGCSFEENNGLIFIKDVRYNSPAALAGLRPGMRIMSINRENVTSLQKVKDILSKAIIRGYITIIVSDGFSKRQITIQLK